MPSIPSKGDSVSDAVTSLLQGGDKTGDDRCYVVRIPLADRLYDQHLHDLQKEGLLDG